MSKKILIGIGTRPEAIKLAPLVHQLKSDDNFDVIVCATGQHKEMLDGVLSFFDIVPDVNFALMKKTNGLLDLSAQIMTNLNAYIEEQQPDLIIGQGDTTTAFMMALAAYYKKINFAHVEAGLRTNNLYSPWPEEGNRKMISAIANFHFAPTQEAKENLIREGVNKAIIYVTGNTVIDALLFAADKTDEKLDHLSKIQSGRKMVLITGHRRENLGKNFFNIFNAIKNIAAQSPDVQFVFPMHPSPAVRKDIQTVFGTTLPENILLIEPQEYPDFVRLMKASSLIITDSGGIQEEAPSLNKPVLVTRDTTERPEGVEAGVVKLVGTNTDDITFAALKLLKLAGSYKKMAQAKNPYGDGTAAAQIREILKNSV